MCPRHGAKVPNSPDLVPSGSQGNGTVHTRNVLTFVNTAAISRDQNPEAPTDFLSNAIAGFTSVGKV